MKYYYTSPSGFMPARLSFIRAFLELREELEANEWRRKHLIDGRSVSAKHLKNRLEGAIKNSYAAMERTRRNLDSWSEQPK